LTTTATACALAVVCLGGSGTAQTSAPPAQTAPATAVSIVVAKPTYISIPLEIAVNRPAAEVWKRVGKFCDIGEWLRIPCTITSGKDGEFGAVRSVANEVLVGKTELSYTYTQPVREGRPYNLYHGTLEARPVTATTSKLVYTLFFDNSMLADDAARADRILRIRRDRRESGVASRERRLLLLRGAAQVAELVRLELQPKIQVHPKLRGNRGRLGKDRGGWWRLWRNG